MRYLFFALAPIALASACTHEQSGAPTRTTSAEMTSPWDAGPTELQQQGWDNSKSNQVADPPGGRPVVC
jgi:hypothetical protein